MRLAVGAADRHRSRALAALEEAVRWAACSGRAERVATGLRTGGLDTVYCSAKATARVFRKRTRADAYNTSKVQRSANAILLS